MKLANPLRRRSKRVAHRLLERIPCVPERRDADAGVGDVDAVDSLRPVANRDIAARANIGDDLTHGILRADLPAE